MRASAVIRGTRCRWIHLLADSSAELDFFARILSLNPDLIQFPGTFRKRYAITERMRQEAIENGAVPIGIRETGLLPCRRTAPALGLVNFKSAPG